MLDPDGVERIGSSVRKVYGEAERELLAMLKGQAEAAIRRGVDYQGMSDSAADVVHRCEVTMAQYRGELRSAATLDVVRALEASDREDLRRLGVTLRRLPDGLRLALSRGSAETVAGILRMIDRDNLSMAGNARTVWLSTVARYSSMVQAGGISADDAVLRAGRDLARDGVKVVTYDNNGRPRREKPDVAVARHIRSQVSQTAGDRTMRLCRELGCDLVEVTSHAGARPSHAEWQGRVYSLSGKSKRYPSFAEATGYYGTGPHGALGDRLMGVNCRHGFGPYREGVDRAYSPDPDGDLGWDREEVYRDTQRQRELERQVRAARLDAAAAESDEDRTAAQARIWGAQERLRQLTSGKPWLHRAPANELAPGLARQPRGRKPRE